MLKVRLACCSRGRVGVVMAASAAAARAGFRCGLSVHDRGDFVSCIMMNVLQRE